MELLNHIVDPVIEHTYTVNHPTEGVLVYKEWIDNLFPQKDHFGLIQLWTI